MTDRTISVSILGDAASLERAFAKSSAAANTFEARMAKVGASTTKVGKTMTRDITLPLAAAGLASVKMAQNFDLLISRMVGLGGVTQKQSKVFRQFILDLAPKVGKGPEELANGLYQIVSAGVKGKAALEALTVSAKASAAGLGDTATVADAVTSVMNAYAKSGMTATTAANVLSAAVRDGKGEAASFAPVLGKVVAVAAQLGVPFDQAAAALAQMTKLGVPADDAATQLSATFSELLKTTPKAEKALEAMGLSAAGLRQELRDKGLLATLQTLNEHTKGSSVAMAEAFPNVRALRGILQLVGSAASGTAQTFSDVKNSTHSLSTAFGAASKTDAFKMQQSLAQLKTAAIDLGGALAPVAEAVAKDVGKMAQAFHNLSPKQQDALVKFGELAAIGGPLVLMTGKMITATGEIKKLALVLKGLPLLLGSSGLTGSIALFMANPEVAGFILALGGIAVLSQMGGGGGALGGGQMPAKIGSHALQETGAGAGYKVGKQVVSYTPSTGWYTADAATNDNGKSITSAQAAKMLGVSESTLPGGGVSAGAGATPTQKKELAYASKYGPGSGLTYAWGGVSPITGFDCSGYLMASYAAAGITIPHNTVAQFNDPNAIVVLPGGEQPGDGVYFEAKGSPGQAPRHCGIYIGGGQFIEYFSQGKPAKISDLASKGDYMGARRWLKIAASTGGGGDPAKRGDGSGSNYDPLKGSKTKKAKWVGATQATIISAQGHVAAMLKGLPADLDPVEANAVAHIKAIQAQLHIHMTPAELAKDKVELAKWGKVLHTEITANAKAAAAAAAEAKKVFDRALSLDVSHIIRDFDQNFAAQMTAFDRETQRHLATLAAKKITAVAQTPEEKALADFIASQAAQQHAATLAQQQSDLAAAIATGDPVQIKAAQDAITQQLATDQQQALQDAADASRIAANQAAQDAQDAADKAATEAQQNYQDERDAQKQNLQNINDDQKIALQNHLDDLGTSLDAHLITWQKYLDALRAMGVNTVGLIDPTTGTQIGSSGGGSNAFGSIDPGIAAKLGIAASQTPDALSRYMSSIPHLAAGGIAMHPTVALIGEAGPEAIVPLSGPHARGGSSSAPTLVLNVIDDATLAARLKPHTDGLVRVVLR